VGITKTFLTILTSVIISVAVTLLIQRREHKPDSASAGVASQNFVKCGLDANGARRSRRQRRLHFTTA
jgi:preprotein translocase subunit SecG